MVAGLLGNESSDSNRFTLVTPKSENDVRLQATLGNQNPTGLPVGVVSQIKRNSTEVKKLHLPGTTIDAVCADDHYYKVKIYLEEIKW